MVEDSQEEGGGPQPSQHPEQVRRLEVPYVESYFIKLWESGYTHSYATFIAGSDKVAMVHSRDELCGAQSFAPICNF